MRAVADASRMQACLQDVVPGAGSSLRPQHASPASTSISAGTNAGNVMDRVKAHTRTMSNTIKTATASVSVPAGYAALPVQRSPDLGESVRFAFTANGGGHVDNPHEMRQWEATHATSDMSTISRDQGTNRDVDE